MSMRIARRPSSIRMIALAALIVGLASPAFAVRITEIMYNPAGTTADGPNLEFIEIFNEEPNAVDLFGYHFCEGIEFVFADRRFLAAGAYLVIAADPDALKEQHPDLRNVVGPWGIVGEDGMADGARLANGGERVSLCDNAGVVIATLRYNDRGKWPGAADGTGHSLEIERPYGEQADPDNWSASSVLGGSPGEENPAENDRVPVVLNELYSMVADGEERFVELYNRGEAEVDLSGYYLSIDRGNLKQVEIPADTVLRGQSHISFTESELGLDLSVAEAGERVYFILTNPTGDLVVDARIFRPRVEGLSEARVPDGTKSISEFAQPTPGAVNRIEVESSIVINEIHYNPLDGDEEKEFVEIFNRGESTVDLTGWAFDEGIDFSFPAVSLPAGSYLVIARNPELIRETYELSPSQVIGPETPEAVEDYGRFANGGERVTLLDSIGNVADSVRYQDGGEWPAWPDAGGSSLELIDPYQDNNAGHAWDASDDSHRAPVTEFEYTGTFVQGTDESELHLVLPGRGITIVDDIQMTTRTTRVNVFKTFIPAQSSWRYFKGREAPPADWAQTEFDDDGWLEGRAIIGYGEDDETTVIDDMRGEYTSLFFRQEFELTADDIANMTNFIFDVQYDDGFACFLNGQHVYNENLRVEDDEVPAFDDRARRSRETAELQLDWTHLTELLVEGRNVLAVQVLNSTTNSNDVRFAGQLVNGEYVHEDGPNLLTDGMFETDDYQRSWVIQGTHVHSGRTTKQSISGDGSLKIISTGNGDNKVNRIETSNTGLARLTPGAEYRVSLKAKWVVGVAALLTHGKYTNTVSPSYATSHQLAIPTQFGTPGAINSVTQRQIDRFGDVNTGPVLTNVKHSPAIPDAGEVVTVEAKVFDPDGLATVMLHYSIDNPELNAADGLVSLAMEDDDSDGVYTATIPGQERRKLVVYYVTATDTKGRTGRFPRDYLAATHAPRRDPEDPAIIDPNYAVYAHDARYNGRLLSYRCFMHKGNELALSRRPLHSNDLIDATFVFGNEDVYYNSKVRFSGSPWARQAWSESWRVRMPRDKPLWGEIKKFGMEDHQGSGARDARERVSHYLLRFSNTGQTRVPYSRLWLAQWQVNSRVNEPREHYGMPNREFLEQWYPDDHTGPFLEMDDRHTITDSGTRQASNDAFVRYPPVGSPTLGADKEQYRYFFMPRGGNPFDDWTDFIEFCRVMTPNILSEEEFDERIWEIADVEEILRIWSVRLNTDDWDTWGGRRGKNCYWYLPPNHGRWVLLAWDMELTYGDINAFRPPRVSQSSNPTWNMDKFREATWFVNRPRIKRMYYGILNEMVAAHFDGSFLAPYASSLDQAGMTNTGIAKPNGYVDRRKRNLVQDLRSTNSASVPFEVTTNDGAPIEVIDPRITIEGIAPVDIFSMSVRIDDEDTDLLDVRFKNDDFFGWIATGEVPAGTHTVEFLGFDSHQNFVARTSIEVTAGHSATLFIRGDVDLNGKINITDAIHTLLHLFGGKTIPCRDAADTNDDGSVNQTDAIATLGYLFQRGAPPANPFPGPGEDTTEDLLTCTEGIPVP